MSYLILFPYTLYENAIGNRTNTKWYIGHINHSTFIQKASFLVPFSQNTHLKVEHKLLMPMTVHQFTGMQHSLTLLRHKHVKDIKLHLTGEKLSSNTGSQQPYPHRNCAAELQAETHTYI